MATISAIPSTKISGGSFLLEERKVDEVFTPEDFTEQHQLIGQTAEEFAVNEILPNAEKMEHKDYLHHSRSAEEGGGPGAERSRNPRSLRRPGNGQGHRRRDRRSHRQVRRLRHHLGRTSGIGTLPIVYFGTEEQKKKYLPRLAAGEIVGAYALSEASSGSDALNCRARAQLSPDGKHYILNGEKMWITNAGFADLFTVFAKVDGEKFSAFLVERSFPGFSVGAEEHKMGIRGSSTCPLILNDCKVPVENLLGEIGKGHVIAFNILNVGRFKLGAMCVGGARLVAGERDCIRQAAQGIQQSDRRLRSGAREAGQHGDFDLRWRGAGLSHRRHDGCRAQRSGQSRRRCGQRNPQGDRGVCGGMLHPQGLGLGDDRLRGR